MEALTRQAKLQMLHVPFTGGAPASTALVAGQVDAAFLNAGPAEALAREADARLVSLDLDPTTGTLTIVVRRRAQTLLAHRVEALDGLVRPTVEAQASTN
jgi:ABC-type nitrate/sulfonate/bicarbonate transport system substrate-binding protein